MPVRKKQVRKMKKSSGESVKPKKEMLSIWFFVGLMLTVLGIIISMTGINYIFHPQNATRLAELNPNLWWGGVILAAGLIFLISSWRRYKIHK